jgi:UDP-3-O-[3-hydroxymyristoyl] glucosamine N-acyltransferase
MSTPQAGTASSRKTSFAITLSALADLIGGQVEGDGSTLITGAEILGAAGPGEITLADHTDRLRQLADSSAAAVIVPVQVPHGQMPAIVVTGGADEVQAAFAYTVTRFRPQRRTNRLGISGDARISAAAHLQEDVDVHPGATIGADVCIGRGSTIGCGAHVMAGCEIGAMVTLMPGVVLYEGTKIGDRTLVHAGAVLGAYGFGYSLHDDQLVRCAQLGYVNIGPDVEIGANTTIDRGTYGATTIGAGTKIDNSVQIGHNCQIGKHNRICSQVGIAGSCSTGDYVVIAGQVGFKDHVHIGDHAVLGGKSGILNHVPAGAYYVGYPATPERDQKLRQAAFTKLPEMRKALRKMQRQIAMLSEQMGAQFEQPRPDERAA